MQNRFDGYAPHPPQLFPHFTPHSRLFDFRFLNMNAVVETLPNCLATLRVEVGPDRVSQTRETLVHEFLKDARIPGFRPGKAPRAVVEKRFQKQISEDLESRILNTGLQDAIREKGLRVLHVQNVEDVRLEDNTFSFSATVVTVPSFDLPDYKGIAVSVPAEVVADADVEEALNSLRERQADFVDITEDRGAAMEDFAVVDYTGTIGGKPVHDVFPKVGKILSENEGFWLRMTDASFFPGFCANLVGAKVGEKREFQVEAPAGFPIEGFGGQKLDYVVTLKELKQRVLPELNDEFAQGFLPGKGLADLKEVVLREMETRKKAEIDGLKRDQIMQHLLSLVECELPEDMARAESNRVLSEVVQENQRRGVTQEMLKENEKELVATASQTARNRLKGSFILSRIAEQEKLEAKSDEILGRIANMAQSAQITLEKAVKEVRRRRMIQEIESDIITAKALDFVVESATVTVTEAKAE